VADELGFEQVDAMLEHYVSDSIAPGICTACGVVEEVCEPDATDNYCGACDETKVKSIFVLAGVM